MEVMEVIRARFEDTEGELGTIEVDYSLGTGMFMCEGAFRARRPHWEPILIYNFVQSNMQDFISSDTLWDHYNSNDHYGYYQRQDQCRLLKDDNYTASMRPFYYIEWVFTSSLFYSEDIILMNASYSIHRALFSAFNHPSCQLGFYSQSFHEDEWEEEDDENLEFYDSYLEPTIHEELMNDLRSSIRDIFQRYAEFDFIINLLIQEGQLHRMVNLILNSTFHSTKFLENALLLFEHVFENDEMDPLDYQNSLIHLR